MAANWALCQAAQADLRQNIRQMAADRAWTFARIARATGIRYQHLNQALNAKRWFLPDEVSSIAAEFEISEDELLGNSLYKDDAPGSDFDKPTYREKQANVGTGNGRALCCDCGTLRRFGDADVDPTGPRIYDLDEDMAGRRLVVTLPCRICDRSTVHAELRSGASRDIAEEVTAAPTREQEAIARRDALIQRLAGFGVDVHFRSRRREEERAEGYTTCYSFDESKDRWRIEIDPNTPGRVQSVGLLAAWQAIAMDKHEGVTWDPRKGVVSATTDRIWEAATEDLVADIQRSLPVEQQRLRVALADEIAHPDDTEVSR